MQSIRVAPKTEIDRTLDDLLEASARYTFRLSLAIAQPHLGAERKRLHHTIERHQSAVAGLVADNKAMLEAIGGKL